MALLAAFLIIIGKTTRMLTPEEHLTDFYEKKDKIETIIAGSSHALSIHAGSISKPSYNLATPGGDLEIIALKIRATIGHTPALKRVIITLGSGYLNYCKPSNNLGFYKRIQDTPIPTSFSEISTLDYTKILISRALFLRHNLGKLKEGIPNLLVKATDATFQKSDGIVKKASRRIQEDGLRIGYHTRTALNRRIAHLAKKTVNAHITNYKDCSSSNENLIDARYKLLSNLANTLHEKDVLMYFVVPPFTREYFEDSRLAKYKQIDIDYIKRLISATPNTKFLDFHDFFYEKYETKNAVFKDDDHLNFYGAKIFSASLRKIIESSERTQVGG